MNFFKKLSILLTANKPGKYDVVLTNCGLEKIMVIKEVRILTGAGLDRAKHAVEDTPVYLKKGLSFNEAVTIKKKFTSIGATVVIVNAKKEV